MTKSLKQLRESAVSALEQGVGNKGALLTAVPLLVELQEAVDSANKTAKRCKEIGTAGFASSETMFAPSMPTTTPSGTCESPRLFTLQKAVNRFAETAF